MLRLTVSTLRGLLDRTTTYVISTGLRRVWDRNTIVMISTGLRGVLDTMINKVFFAYAYLI